MSGKEIRLSTYSIEKGKWKCWERQGPRPFSHDSVVGSDVPMHSYQDRGRLSQKGFIHESSFFQNSQLPYRSNFDIHPEWVSEVKTLKRNDRTNAGKGARSVRYVSKYPPQ